MKKLLALLLVLTLCIGSMLVFTACGDKDENEGATLADAVEYLGTTYKTDEGKKTSSDYYLIARIPIGEDVFNVSWTCDNALVSITLDESKNLYLVDVPAANETEVTYTLTATVSDADGNSETKTFTRVLPVLKENTNVSLAPVPGTAYNMAYAHGNLENTVYYVIGGMSGYYMATSKNANDAVNVYVEEVEGGYNLYCISWGNKLYINMITTDTGYVNASFDEAPSTVYTYDETLKTLVAAVGTQTYMFGTKSTGGATYTTIGPVVTNSENYFYASFYESTLPDQEASTLTTPEEIVNAAYELGPDESLGAPVTLTGIITKIDTPYSDQYKNITVTIVVGDMTDKPIVVYRVKGDGADQIAVGDEITVTGTIVNYAKKNDSGEITSTLVEFTTPCTLDSWVDNTTGGETGGDETPALTTPEEIVNAAYELEPGESLSAPVTLTGIITEINDAYSEQYKNITVTIVVGDMTDKPILVFRVKGDGADQIAVGDEITVSGTIVNYAKYDDNNELVSATIEFTTPCTLDSWVDNTTGGEDSGETGGEDSGETGGETEEIATITIAEANTIAAGLESGATTTEYYYVTGIITSISNANYGNVYIATEDGTASIYVYGINDENGTAYGSLTDKPGKGDTVTLLCTIANYYGTKELTNGVLVSYVAHTCSYSEPTCDLPATCALCGATNGEALGHSYTDGVCTTCGVNEPSGESVTVTVSVADYASANSWANSTMYNTMTLDDNITVTANGGSNTGKYYTSGNTWRIYQNESPSVVITAANGYSIVSVKITYEINKTGTLTLDGEAVASETVVIVNDSSVTFSVGNTDASVSNGQVRITAIEVVYA